MKVLDLQCEHGQVFEGWFGSENDYQDQLNRSLVQCPLCASDKITKRLSAPRLNFGKARQLPLKSTENAEPASSSAPIVGNSGNPDGSEVAPTADLVAMPAPDQALAAAWMAMSRRILANTVDVGPKFAEEARKIHYGETKERAIRGQASPDETQALMEEGIAVMPFFVPDALKGTLHSQSRAGGANLRV